MLTNAERLALLKSLPPELSDSEREEKFIAAMRKRQAELSDLNPAPLSRPSTVTVERRPCGTCGGGKVR